MAKPELALEVLGQLIAQLRDDAPAISALTPDQQVATSWYVLGSCRRYNSLFRRRKVVA